MALVLSNLGNQFNSFQYDQDLGVYYCFELVKLNQNLELQLTFCAGYEEISKLEIRFNDMIIFNL